MARSGSQEAVGGFGSWLVSVVHRAMRAREFFVMEAWKVRPASLETGVLWLCDPHVALRALGGNSARERPGFREQGRGCTNCILSVGWSAQSGKVIPVALQEEKGLGL